MPEKYYFNVQEDLKKELRKLQKLASSVVLVIKVITQTKDSKSCFAAVAKPEF